MDYYSRLRDIREDNDLTQGEISTLLETTQQQISKWETGVQMMGVDKYIKLARFYNISTDYLLGLIDKPRKLYYSGDS
ncbi:MAG: helix-turn-helix transcriptional regulator [Clostridia bacterium]|nr:helix-turn-helix transcriptional regulator [Clostridia bacterium]